jgi:hypothetical protein
LDATSKGIYAYARDDEIKRKLGEEPKQIVASRKGKSPVASTIEDEEDFSDSSTDSIYNNNPSMGRSSNSKSNNPAKEKISISTASSKSYMRDMTASSTSSSSSFSAINIVKQQQQQHNLQAPESPINIQVVSHHSITTSLSKRPGSVSTEVGSMPYVAKQTLHKSSEMSISYAVEGYLSMYVPKKKKWKARWFELHDGDLVIRKKKSGRKSQVIPLYSVLFKHYAEDETCFEINTSKSLILVSAANVQEKELWEDEIWKHKKVKREKRIKSLLFRVSKKNVDFEEYKDEQKKKYEAEIDRQIAVKNRKKTPTPLLRANTQQQESSSESTPPTASN